MSNPAKQKGTLAETAVVDFMRLSFPLIERRALSGSQDKGDIAGVPNWVLEVKNHRSPSYQAWLREAETERRNAGVDYGAVISKPHGVGTNNIHLWHVVMTLGTFTELISRD